MKRHRPSLLGAIALTLSTALIPLDAFADAGFQKWIRDFYPVAAKAGITAVIQPGGSMRDNEVIAAANEHGLAMVFTGVRHFRH